MLADKTNSVALIDLTQLQNISTTSTKLIGIDSYELVNTNVILSINIFSLFDKFSVEKLGLLYLTVVCGIFSLSISS